MFSLYWWALSSITGSILGSATNAWFKKTKMGKWFYKKIENWYTWAADRYGFEILKAEDKWRKKFPNVAQAIKHQEEQIKKLDKRIETIEFWHKDDGK